MNAKGLLAVPLLGFALAACSVTVTPTAPTITNVKTQSTYCLATNKKTVVDIKFDLGGGGIDSLTKLDIFLGSDTDTPSTLDTTNAPHDVISTSFVNVGTATRYQTSYTLTPEGYTGPASLSPLAIIVTPVGHKIFLRGSNGSSSGPIVEATPVLTGSTDTVNCDPPASSVQ